MNNNVSYGIKDAAIKIWGIILSLVAIVLLIITANAVVAFVISQLYRLNGRTYSGTYADIGLNVLELIVFLYAIFYLADYLSARSKVNLGSQHNTNDKSRWYNKLVPFRRFMNGTALFGVGYAIAMFMVSGNLEVQRIQQIREIHRLEHKLEYLANEPAFVYYFEPAGISVSSIREGFFSSTLHTGHVSEHNAEELLQSATEFYNEAKLKADIKLVEIIGYADVTGNIRDNKKISLERAIAVREHLIEAGVPEEMISVRSAGVHMEGCDRFVAEKRDECLAKARVVRVYLRGEIRG